MIRARSFWLIGGAAALATLASGVLVLHEVATTRWPRLVMRWSPSFDHRLRAGLTEAARAGGDVAARRVQLLGLVQHAALDRLEKTASAQHGPGHRAAVALVLRGGAREPADAAPRARLRRLLRDGPAPLRLELVECIARHDPRGIGLALPALADPHPAIAATAAALVARGRICASLSCPDAKPILMPWLRAAAGYVPGADAHAVPAGLLAADGASLTIAPAPLDEPVRAGPWRSASAAEIEALVRLARLGSVDALLDLDADAGLAATSSLLDADARAADALVPLLRRTGKRAKEPLGRIVRMDAPAWEPALDALLALELDRWHGHASRSWADVGAAALHAERRARVAELVTAAIAKADPGDVRDSMDRLRLGERSAELEAAIALLPERWRSYLAEEVDGMYGHGRSSCGFRRRMTLADYCLDDLIAAPPDAAPP